MVKEYYNQVQRQPNIDLLDDREKARIWLDKLLAGEIDLKTFKEGINILLPTIKHRGEDIAYL